MKIFVLIFWLLVKGNSVTIESAEVAGIAPTPQVCAQVDVLEAVGHVKDGAANLAKGLRPAIVCGITAPAKEATPAEPPKADPGSTPGNGDWDKGPSGGI